MLKLCCACDAPASSTVLPVALNVPACCTAALYCSCAAAVTWGACSMSDFCKSCAFATASLTSGCACSTPFCSASAASCCMCVACSSALLKKSMSPSCLLRRGIPTVDGENPAQRAGVLVELADRPAQPAERGGAPFLRTPAR